MTQAWAEVVATDTRDGLTVQRVVRLDVATPDPQRNPARDPDRAWQEALALVTGVPGDALEVRRVIELP